MNLAIALSYPYQDPQRWRRLLPLALLQLIPIVGQLILVGYGQAVARAVVTNEHLPPLDGLRAFIDGAKVVGVGLVICLPIFITVLLMVGTTSVPETGSSGPPMAIFPVILITFTALSNWIAKNYPAYQPGLDKVKRLFGFIFLGFVVYRLRGLVTLLQDGIQFSTLSASPSTMPVLAVAAFFLALFLVIILIHATRYALTGHGLLNPRGTLAELARNPLSTLRFIGMIWLLAVLILVAAIAASLMLVVPGLIIFAAGSVSLWVASAKFLDARGLAEFDTPLHLHTVA